MSRKCVRQTEGAFYYPIASHCFLTAKQPRKPTNTAKQPRKPTNTAKQPRNPPTPLNNPGTHEHRKPNSANSSPSGPNTIIWPGCRLPWQRTLVPARVKATDSGTQSMSSNWLHLLNATVCRACRGSGAFPAALTDQYYSPISRHPTWHPVSHPLSPKLCGPCQGRADRFYCEHGQRGRPENWGCKSHWLSPDLTWCNVHTSPGGCGQRWFFVCFFVGNIFLVFWKLANHGCVHA